jgi:DNA-binding SARP family transcriptional activator/tetratricopeptide (TPR) repeat protein
LRAEGPVDAGLSIHVFGAVRAWRRTAGDTPPAEIPLGPAQRRAVLAVLVFGGSRPVPRDQIVAELWGEAAPRTAANAVQTHIKGLRQALEPGRLARRPSLVIPSVGDGYTLRLPDSAVDVWRFRQAVVAARQARHDGDHDRVWAVTARALALWAPPAADLAALAAHPDVEILTKKRWTVLDWHVDAALRLGRAGQVVDLAEAAARQRPLDELAQARVMRVYQAVGRRGDGFRWYGQVRRRLADELGVDPGQQLQAAHRALLADEAAEDQPAGTALLVAPAQLPATPGHFTGRTNELAALDRLAAADRAGPAIAVVTGAGGMGKTALAVHWAHQVADRFPDGQLYLDLRGDDVGAELTASGALAQALRGFGVPVDRIPGNQTEQVNLYRSLLHRKRVLVVVDNASSSMQVLPLVPASPTCLLLVTSRNQLAGLAVRHAVDTIDLGVLPPPDALALLRSGIGARRVDAEPAAAAELIGQCAGLPLAIRLAAARLGTRRQQHIGDLVSELAGEPGRLAAFEIEDCPDGLYALFDSAYQTLSAAAATMFRQLGSYPVRTFTTHLAATVAGSALRVGDRAVRELAAAHLITPCGPRRYTLHDLTRRYAVERAARDEPPERRASALDRLLEWYLAVTEPVNKVTSPHRGVVLSRAGHPPAELPFPPGDLPAIAFLDQERDNLIAVVGHAQARGRTAAAWQLAYQLFGYYLRRGHGQDSVEVFRQGLSAAADLRDPVAESSMHHDLAVAYRTTRRPEEALPHLRRALELAEGGADLALAAGCLNVIGLCLADLGRYDESLEALEQALVLSEKGGDQLRIGMTLNNIGAIHRYRGNPREALRYYGQALDNRRALGHRYGMLISLSGVGEAHLALADQATALEHFQAALALAIELADRRQEAITTSRIAAAHFQRGNLAEAAARWSAALVAYQESGDRHGEAATLTNLGRAKLSQAELGAAADHLRRAADLRARIPDRTEEALLREALAELADRLAPP